ncbi:MAG: PRC-barrel domain-containing protein, partial [Pararhodobacter sp.]
MSEQASDIRRALRQRRKRQMKKLLSTTALVVTLGFPAMTLAQTTTTTTAPAADQTTMQQQGQTEPFLAERGQSDLFASELIGQDVYARRTGADGTMGATTGAATDPAAATTATGTTGTAAGTTGTAAETGAATGTGQMHAGGAHGATDMRRADLDTMDNIGQINEIVLSNDGQVRALVIGIGGFLGMGEQEVAVSMDQVSFASDPDDRSQVYVVVNTSAELLQESPAYERSAMMDGTAARTGTGGTAGTTGAGLTQTGAGGAGGDRTAFVAPDMQREGYAPMEAVEITAETLTGQTVYDVNDDSVGDIDDLILDDSGSISQVVIDFGGFLGIGSSQVAVGF